MRNIDEYKQCFCFGEILPNFSLRNMILTYSKILHEKNEPNLLDFQEE